jgi:hypothetical protein
MTSPFLHQWSNVTTLETVDASLIMQGLEAPTLEQHEIKILRDERDLILSRPVIETPKLSTWQIRVLLLPGSFHVLNDYQSCLLCHKLYPQRACAAGFLAGSVGFFSGMVVGRMSEMGLRWL